MDSPQAAPVQLNLGCGHVCPEGWINIDGSNRAWLASRWPVVDRVLVSLKLPPQRPLSGTPVGSPATIATMLDFCVRHRIKPVTEHFEMAQANDALEHLRGGKARYRGVLSN